MAHFFRNAFKQALAPGLFNQFARPVKSLTGYAVSKACARQTYFLNKLAIDSLNVSKGDKVLELGYGRGAGIGYCLQKMEGEGLICGIERSGYMEEVARKRFTREITESHVVNLDKCLDLGNIPYPSDYFDSIYHVDFVFFLHHKQLPEICGELLRVLKPGGRMVCGTELKRFIKLTKWGILDDSQWDPVKYILGLKLAGFNDVQINNIQRPFDRSYQLLSAQKPKDGDDEDNSDLETRLPAVAAWMDTMKIMHIMNKTRGERTDKELQYMDRMFETLTPEEKKDVKEFRRLMEKKKNGHALTKEELEFLDKMEKMTSGF